MNSRADSASCLLQQHMTFQITTNITECCLGSSAALLPFLLFCAATCLALRRPSWLEKYRHNIRQQPGRTIVYFAADRSAMAVGSFQEQQQRGFASAFYAMPGYAWLSQLCRL
jgi:hypothetical protein